MYDVNLRPHPARDPRLPPLDDRRRRRVDRQPALGRGHARLSGRTGLRRHEGRRRALHHVPGRRAGSQGHPGQWHRARPDARRPRSTTSTGLRRPRPRDGSRGRRSAGSAGPRTRPGSRSSWPATSRPSSPATTSRSTAARRRAAAGSGHRRPAASSTARRTSDPNLELAATRPSSGSHGRELALLPTHSANSRPPGPVPGPMAASSEKDRSVSGPALAQPAAGVTSSQARGSSAGPSMRLEWTRGSDDGSASRRRPPIRVRRVSKMMRPSSRARLAPRQK